MTSPARLVELNNMRIEFEASNTTDERRSEILTKVREFAEEETRPRCLFCKHAFFYVEYGYALIEGHVYSPAGLADIDITHVCEFCFDKTCEEVEDEEQSNQEPIRRLCRCNELGSDPDCPVHRSLP